MTCDVETLRGAIRERAKALSPRRIATSAGVSHGTVYRFIEEGSSHVPNRDTVDKLRRWVSGDAAPAAPDGSTLAAVPNAAAPNAAAPNDSAPGLPPLAPQWEGSPTFWYGVQWALRGLMGRMTELQDAVLAHGAALASEVPEFPVLSAEERSTPIEEDAPAARPRRRTVG